MKQITGKYRLFQYALSDVSKNRLCYLMLFPAFIYTFIFGYMTLPYILIAFQQFNYRTGILNSKWIGFKNFEFFIKSNYSFSVTWNTIKLNLMFILSIMIFSLFFAIIINEIKNKWFIKISQASFLFPYFLSWIVVTYIVYNFFSTDYGWINRFLESMGFSKVSWYSRAAYWPWILTLVKTWKEAGMSIIIYLAAISGIDGSLYESAYIDGAGRWKKIRYITIPLLMPTVMILLLLSLGRVFYGDFGMIYAIVRDNSILFTTTDVIDTYVFRVFRKIGDPSMAMAVGLYQSVLGFVLVYICNSFARKHSSEGAIF